MFTIKLYTGGGPDGYKQRILSADSFTILRGDDGSAEITLHNGNDGKRYDIGFVDPEKPRPDGWPDIWERAIIENVAGRTTEMIGMKPWAENARIAKMPLRPEHQSNRADEPKVAAA